jgi:hypothetical protein
MPDRPREPAPWGHSEMAHAHLGFCAQCPGRSWAAEATGWRVYAQQGSFSRRWYRLLQRRR